jgi:hypothetical protein
MAGLPWRVIDLQLTCNREDAPNVSTYTYATADLGGKDMSQPPPPGPPEGWDRPSGEPTQPLGQGSGQQPPAQPQGPPTAQQPPWNQPPPGSQARPGWGLPPTQPNQSPDKPWYQRWWWAIALGMFVLGGVIGAAGSSSDPQAAPATVTVTSIQEVARYEPLCSNYLDEEDQRSCEEREQEIRDATKASMAAESTPTTATTKPKPAPAPEQTFGDGIYKVGADIKPGSYRTAGGSNCYYARLRTDDNSDIIANNITSGPQRMTVRSTDGYVEFSGGCEWKPA